jgi:hypothetical protein
MFLVTELGGAQPVMSERQWDSLAAGFRSQLLQVTSPALEQRKAERLDLQRRGYVHTLSAALRGNALDGLLAFIRTKLQLEFSLSHEPLTLAFPLVAPDRIPRNARGFVALGERSFSVTLADDWTFPVDPWEKRTP